MSNLLDELNDYDHSQFNNGEIADACRILGLLGPLEALLKGLRIESSEHLSRRDRQNEIKSDKKNENGQKSGQESWGKDSGARDLSPELHKLNASSGANSQVTENDFPSSTMLSLARKLQNGALSALKIEVEELSTRLRYSERERDTIQCRLNDALEEKEETQRRLQLVGSAHESRITELHCVIAELKKKLKTRQDNAIVEEVEPDGSVSELSFQEGSVYNSEMEAINYDNESRTDSIDCNLKDESNLNVPLKEIFTNNQSTTNSAQIQALQEEVIHLRVQLALLQSQLASENENKIKQKQKNNNDDKLEKDESSDAISCCDDDNYNDDDIDASNKFQNKSEFLRHSTAKNVKTSSIDLPPVKDKLPSVKSHGNIGITTQQYTSETPIAKMAERVRLRRTVEEQHLTGVDLTASGIFTTEIAEHLVSDILRPESSADICDPYRIQNENILLQRRMENMRFQNSVLTLTLAESKSHCEKLYLLCGKYESNAIALHQALNYCDRTIEGYDVLLALLESKVSILEGDDLALENQKITETVGKNLLLRLQSESSIPENSVGPWQNTDGICSNHSLDGTPWTEDDYVSLRNLVSKYKALRQLVQNTSVQLESPFYDNTKEIELRDTKDITQHNDNRRLDLETAVLMQELMGMREEVSEIKFRLDQAERGKTYAEQRAGALQDALVYLQAQLDDTEQLLAKANKNRPSFSESEHAAGIERELVEALARESRFKARLQCLTSALETAAKTSEEKYAQVQNTVTELKQANLTLNQSFEKCKRKYQSRLKSLEQKLLGIQMNKSHQSSHSSKSHDAVVISKSNDRINDGRDKIVPETTL